MTIFGKDFDLDKSENSLLAFEVDMSSPATTLCTVRDGSLGDSTLDNLTVKFKAIGIISPSARVTLCFSSKHRCKPSKIDT
jgi:hypothetical protein